MIVSADTVKEVTQGGAIQVTPRVEWSPDWTNYYPLNPVSGSTTQDRSTSNRWSMTGSFAADYELGYNGIHPYGCRLRMFLDIRRLRMGVLSIPYGEYYVTSVDKSSEGLLNISGQSYEWKCVQNRFIQPRTFPSSAGMTKIEQMELLIREAVPDAQFRWQVTDEIMAKTTVDDERWTLIKGTAKKLGISDVLGADVFCDAQGVFTGRDVPTFAPENIQWVFTREDATSNARGLTAEGVINLVAAMGTPEVESTGNPLILNQTIGPYFAWDNDPFSVTFAGYDPIKHPEEAGRYGVVVLKYSSPLLLWNSSVMKAAATRLRNREGQPRTLEFDTTFNFALEAGDVVRYDVETGRNEMHILDKITWSWGDPTMSCTTRTKTTSSTIGILGPQATEANAGDL